MQRNYGVPTQLLTPDEAAHFVPGTKVDDLQGAAFCDQDGYCDALAIRNGYLARAQQLGAHIQHETPVTGIRVDDGQMVAVATPAGDVPCDVVVNAAGGWAGTVGALAGLMIPVQPFRRHIYVLDPREALAEAMPFTFDVDSGFFMRQAGTHLWCGKVNPAEPPGQNLAVDWTWLPQVLAPGCARFPILCDATVNRAQSWAGSYEITLDHAPILGRHPALPNYVDACGFSGHGIMHAPATGLLMAEEILDGQAHTINIDEFRVTRFHAGRGAHEGKIF